MKTTLLATALIGTLTLACSTKQKNIEEYPEFNEPAGTEILSEAELIKRGSYLVTIAGCNDCHSPKIMTPHGPEPDPSRLMSGHPDDGAPPPAMGSNGWLLFSPGLTAFVGPWGVSYAANLTPDDSGIGAWTFENFKTAIRKGKLKGLEGSRDLLPPMPWQMYRNMSDEDLNSVFHYLKSLPPVKNLVPAPKAPTV